LKKVKFNKVHKILVIKPAAIGDVLLSTPVIENLRYHFPDVEINFLTQKYCKEALTGNPFISRILTYNLDWDSGWFIIKKIRKQKYDMVIDLYCNPRTALITFLSGARYKVGFRFRGRTYAYNIKVKRRSNEIHNVEFNLDVLKVLGLEIISFVPKFYINEIHREFAENFFEKNNLINSTVIGINPAGTWPTKVWYAEKFSRFIKSFDQRFNFILFWGNESEKNIAEKINAETDKRAVLIPETNLKYMGAIAEKCAVFLTNDTGPMHIAAALGVNIVAIFGPTNSKLQGPSNFNSIVVRNESLSCLGCNLTTIEDCRFEHKCMKELAVTDVVFAVNKILSSSKS
jgi:lipopolysaccharide heptosyltransferase II